MARRRFILVVAGLLSFSAVTTSLAQGKSGNRPGRGTAAVRERWSQMSPEDRNTFRRNAERWVQLSPEQQMIMRQRELLRRQQIKQEAEVALREAGMNLDVEKRRKFEERYAEERRRVERALREEMEAKRRQQLPTVHELLKKEFQGHTHGSASPAHSPK